MPKLLWIGDAAVSTGFARITHEVLTRAVVAKWDVTVLGINHSGDPCDLPFPVYPCAGPRTRDFFGLGRVKELVDKVKPDLVVVQNDPWNMEPYLKKVAGAVPVIGAVAVDGANCAFGDKMNGLTHAIFWTQFGLEEARLGGYNNPATVIPLGVDLDIYKPVDREDARRHLGLQDKHLNSFIVGNINRNQPRKRLDLTIQYFAEWQQQSNADAYLFLHIAPTGEDAVDAKQLMRHFGMQGRLIYCEPPDAGVSEAELAKAYSAFDVQVSTTQGEGWGLTTMEGMACGVPQIVPDWSALGEWARPAARLVPCDTISVSPGGINVVGGIPNRQAFIAALDEVHKSEELRAQLSINGTRLVCKDRFRWSEIAEAYLRVFEKVLENGPQA